MIKKTASLLLSLTVAASCLTFTGCSSESNAEIYDSGGGLLSTSLEADPKSDNFAYLDIAISEAKTLVSEETLKKGCKIYTYCDTRLISGMKTACNTTALGFEVGCAMTDLQGRLIAAYSSTETNLATQKNQPYSAIKPLAVYAPAMENGTINWSTLFEDSAYKTLEDQNGTKTDWPKNATGIYSGKNVTVYNAVKQSLNTVAVKCLNTFGVNNSIDFLRNSFGMDLDYELQKSVTAGEEEVIGNIAMGYTYAGSSPAEMAGYYQIFAGGGKYAPHRTVKRIEDSDGKVLYEDKTEAKQVISPETAYVMNQLLKGVITPGGTGEKAHCGDIPVAGKTGTGDLNAGNWFVGVTPEFSCAVWHNKQDENRAAELFSEITLNAGVENKLFMTSAKVEEKIFCPDSGKLLSTGCKRAELGYYESDRVPEECNIH